MSMDTTTTEQALAVLEMWSTKLTQYVSALGLVVVLYDFLLTMKDEVCLILSHPRAVSIFFLMAGAPCLARRPEFPKSLVLH